MEPRAGTTTQDAVGPYLRAVRRRWRFVTLVTLLTAAVATVTALRAGSTYATSASVLVTPLPQADPTFVGTGAVVDSGDPARTVQTAAALINSPEAASVTASALGGGWTAQRVQRAVSVTPLGQSDVLSVAAQGSNPKQAVELANDFTTAAVAARARIVQRNIANELAALEARGAVLPARGNAAQLSDLAGRIGELRAAQASGGDPTLAVSQRAQPPDAPSGAPHWLVLLLSLFGGFALGSIGALVLEFFSRPVRDVDELTSLFRFRFWARFPRSSTGETEHCRHGCFLREPSNRSGWSECSWSCPAPFRHPSSWSRALGRRTARRPWLAHWPRRSPRAVRK